MIIRTNQFVTCNAAVLAKAHLESPRQPSLGTHGATVDRTYVVNLRNCSTIEHPRTKSSVFYQSCQKKQHVLASETDEYLA